MVKMTTKQRAFAEAYLGEAKFNGTQAARLAGYRGDAVSLAVTASENLRKPNILEFINERLNVNSLRTDDLLDRVSKMAMFDPTLYLDLSDPTLPIWNIQKMSEDGLGQMIRRLRLVDLHGQVVPEVELVNSADLLMWLLSRLDRIEERSTARKVEVSFDPEELRAELDRLIGGDDG